MSSPMAACLARRSTKYRLTFGWRCSNHSADHLCVSRLRPAITHYRTGGRSLPARRHSCRMMKSTARNTVSRIGRPPQSASRIRMLNVAEVVAETAPRNRMGQAAPPHASSIMADQCRMRRARQSADSRATTDIQTSCRAAAVSLPASRCGGWPIDIGRRPSWICNRSARGASAVSRCRAAMPDLPKRAAAAFCDDIKRPHEVKYLMSPNRGRGRTGW